MNPLYTETNTHTLVWLDPDTLKKRQEMPKGILWACDEKPDKESDLKKIQTDTPQKSVSFAIDVSQSPNSNITIDLSSTE